VCNRNARTRWFNVGENSLENEGNRGSDREKAVLKVETVDVIVNRTEGFIGSAHGVSLWRTDRETTMLSVF
jgi:hypothetical protein